MNNPGSSSLIARYQRLIEISTDLASKLDLSALLNHIVRAAAEMCDAEAASILLYDQVNQQLYFEAASNLEAPIMQGLIVPVDSSLAGWIVTNRQPVIINDTQRDPRHFTAIGKSTGVNTRSLLGVPLIQKDKIIGALEAINKHAGDFNEDDQGILMALGAQAAVAIENARLFQQSDLISEIVHELRTPLGSMITAAHLLQRPEISEAQRQSIVQIIQREANRLNEMTSSFLDLARLESGRVHFHFEELEPLSILEEALQVVSVKAAEKQQRLSMQVAHSLPLVSADRDKIKQVVLNLLSNAIKYTPAKGEITLSAHSEPGLLLIQVTDNGPGIPSNSLERVFEKFYRLPGSERLAPGTGLGLSICKKIIEGHSGALDVTSQPDSCTTFTVRLPLKRPV